MRPWFCRNRSKLHCAWGNGGHWSQWYDSRRLYLPSRRRSNKCAGADFIMHQLFCAKAPLSNSLSILSGIYNVLMHDIELRYITECVIIMFAVVASPQLESGHRLTWHSGKCCSIGLDEVSKTNAMKCLNWVESLLSVAFGLSNLVLLMNIHDAFMHYVTPQYVFKLTDIIIAMHVVTIRATWKKLPPAPTPTKPSPWRVHLNWYVSRRFIMNFKNTFLFHPSTSYVW